ncbi:vWA domain-containing protein [Reyranella sp.]|jgi:Ca-activated chloride channel family protein|uniref:vWA domain-containing protein n=1 Tax=Reyranella sp. TaxID=1929291 RepID=UPI002F94DE97
MNAFIESLHFLRPWALLLVVPALALWWAGRRAADTTRRWARVIDPELLKLLVVGDAAARRFAPNDVLMLAWLVAAIAIAGPTWRREPSPFADAQPPVMIVLKVAPSMTTTDLAPTRLDRARQKIADLLKRREGGAAGLIAYSGSAHLVLPPTADHEIVLAMAGALAPAIMPREGDRLADAVALAAQVLRDGGRGGSILIVADTVAPGQAEALEAAKGAPVVFFAVAPAASVEADKPLQAAVSELGARLVETTIDNDDIAVLLRRLTDRGNATMPPGETERWQEAGYWLSFLVAALVLGWFRRGWVIST